MSRTNKILVFLIFLKIVQSDRILLLLPTLSYSHNNWFVPILDRLLQNGHEITAVTTYSLAPFTQDPSNLTEISVYEEASKLNHIIDYIITENAREYILYGQRTGYWAIKPAITEYSDQILSKIPLNSHFDLVLLDWMGYSPLLALASHFQCPLIGIYSQQILTSTYGLIGNPLTLSYRADYNLPHHYPMSFFQRLDNILDTIAHFWHYYASVRNSDLVVARHFNWTKSTVEMEKSVAGFVLNTNPILNGVRPLLPNIIEVGSLSSLSYVKKQLPQDLDNFLNSATNGTVYISMGSAIRHSDLLLRDCIELIIRVCFRMGLKVLLKWDPEKVSSNSQIIASEWLPQKDVLSHPSIKLFVTHGGQQSMEESIAAKVPMLVLPIFADQAQNGNHIKYLGIGETMIMYGQTEKNYEGVIKQMINDQRYKKRALQVGETFLKSIPNPLEKAVNFIDLVMVNQGGEFLRSPAADLDFITYYLLDILLFVLISFICLMLISYWLFPIIYFYLKPNLVIKLKML